MHDIIVLRSTASGRATQVFTIFRKINPVTKVVGMQKALNNAEKEYIKNQGKFLNKKKLEKFKLTKPETEEIIKT